MFFRRLILGGWRYPEVDQDAFFITGMMLQVAHENSLTSTGKTMHNHNL